MKILRILWSVVSAVLHLPHVPRGFRIPRYLHAIAFASFLLGAFLVWYILKGATPREERPPIIFILLPILLPAISYYLGLHLLTPLHRLRSESNQPRMCRSFGRLVFGLLAILFGVSIITWVCYNEFVHRQREYHGFHWWEPFGAGPVMISVGIYWLHGLRRKRAG